MMEIHALLTHARLAGVFIRLQISMTEILALLTHVRQKAMFTNLLTAMMEIRAPSTRAHLKGVFMSLLTAMTEIRALLTLAPLASVFTSLYSARKTCIWESMPGMESTGLPRSLSPNGLSEYKTKSSHLGFANASSIMGFKPKLQL
jgi:hypothetical protein